MSKFNETPVFDRHEDPNNEDFIDANRKKFKTGEDVVDEDSDFTDSLDNQEEAVEVREPVDEQKELEEIRKDIGQYTYKGPDNVALASFHVDHDKEEMVGVTEEGLESFRPTDPETIEGAPLEEEFADNNIVTDRKMSSVGKPERVGKYKIGESNVSDNLKTMPENKIQRNNRGLIRKFLDNVWNKN